MKIYGDLGSGNCLKVKSTADHVGLPYTWLPIDVVKSETRTPESLARHPLGRIPAVGFDGRRRRAESSAINRYLARGSAFLEVQCLDDLGRQPNGEIVAPFLDFLRPLLDSTHVHRGGAGSSVNAVLQGA